MILRAGNVIKTKENRIEIVIDQDDKITRTISFSFENVMSYIPNLTHVEHSLCSTCSKVQDCDYYRNGDKCDFVQYGINDATFLASSVKEYIIEKMLKNFEF